MSKVGEIQATLFRQAEEEMERSRKAGDAQDDEVDGEVKSGKAGGKFEFKLLSRNLCHYPKYIGEVRGDGPPRGQPARGPARDRARALPRQDGTHVGGLDDHREGDPTTELGP